MYEITVLIHMKSKPLLLLLLLAMVSCNISDRSNSMTNGWTLHKLHCQQRTWRACAAIEHYVDHIISTGHLISHAKP